MAVLGKEKVGCSNFVNSNYINPKGEEMHDITASLTILSENRRIRVDEGAQVEIGGKIWEVLEVQPPPEGRGGKVILAEVHPESR